MTTKHVHIKGSIIALSMSAKIRINQPRLFLATGYS